MIDDPRSDKRRRAPARPLQRQDLLRHRRARAARGAARRRRGRAHRAALPVPDRGGRGSSSRRYPALDEVVWVQEEPQNMGAVAVDPPPPRGGRAAGVPLRFVGRPWRASPSEGYPTAHLHRAGPHRARRARPSRAPTGRLRGACARCASAACLREPRAVLPGLLRRSHCALAAAGGGARRPTRSTRAPSGPMRRVIEARHAPIVPQQRLDAYWRACGDGPDLVLVRGGR